MATYYDSGEDTHKPIPKAPFYVLSNDSFMSGWGGANGKINTCVVPCESYEEAIKVEGYVRSRSDQKYIRINMTPPRAKDHVIYSLLSIWKQWI